MGEFCFLLYLVVASYLSQFRPCGNTQMRRSIHSVSIRLRVSSICACVSWLRGVSLCNSCTVILLMLPHASFLKWSCRAPSLSVSFIFLRCVAYLALSDFRVWPTYCLPQRLHCMRYTMYGVSHVAVPCVMNVLLDILLLICVEFISLVWSGHLLF